MSIRKAFKTDKTAENKGVWFDFPEAANDDQSIPGFQLARMAASNVAYMQAVDKAFAPDRKKGDREVTPRTQVEWQRRWSEIEKQNDLAIYIFAEFVVRDWRNVQDENGNFEPYSVEACVKLLREAPDFYSALIALAQEADFYLASRFEEEAKN